MRQAAWLVLGIAAGALVAGGGLIGLQQVGPSGAAAASTPEPVRTATASVGRRDMRSETELDGTLGYADPASLVDGLTGMATNLPSEGRVLRQGDRVMEVDGRQRSGLLYGAKPAWRRMAQGMSEGTDVLQLERALRTLGFLPHSIRPDREYDEDTARAVRRWQHQLGVTRDGVLELGEVVFVPGPVRVGEVRIELGERVGPGTTIASVTSTERVVSVDLDAEDQSLVGVGDAVTVELPDGTDTAGRVSEFGTVASADQEGSVTLPVTITLDEPDASGSLDGAPVTVRVVTESREGVLAVPVEALLALREGGYAVQIVDAEGDSHYVGVKLGLFTDGWVEVTGEVVEGAQVVVPA